MFRHASPRQEAPPQTNLGRSRDALCQQGQVSPGARAGLPDPHNTCTVSGKRAATARPVDRQTGEGKCLCSGAPHHRIEHPPNTFLPLQRYAKAACKSVSSGPVKGSRTRIPCAERIRAASPDCSPHGLAAGEVECICSPSPRRRGSSPPPDVLPPHPRCAISARACERWGQCRTPTPAHCAFNQLAAGAHCLPCERAASGGQVSASGTPHHSTGRPLRRTPAARTERYGSPQERVSRG